MNRVELLTVEDRFLIEGRGVIVIPDFAVPNGWKNRTEIVAVVTPDGQQYEAAAWFNMSHFKPVDPNSPVEKRWRIIILLLDRKREELPVGSKILVSQEARDAILTNHAS